MKFLLLSLIFSGTLFVQSARGSGSTNEIVPEGVSANTFVSAVKEMDVEQTLMQSSQVRDCLEKAKFDPSPGAAYTAEKVAEAEACFKEKLRQVNDPQQIQALSDKLGLQDYRLVQSRNVKDITQYLSDRLYRAMTGVDRKEQEFINFRAAGRKMTDQRDFLDLYKTQLTKNALFEINRFCFLHLRRKQFEPEETAAPKTSSFAEHWAPWFALNRKSIQTNEVTDSGNTAFGSERGFPTDKKKAYKVMADNLEVTHEIFKNPTALGNFFEMCTSQIAPLCQEYEADRATATRGRNACLTKERLRNIRLAIAGTEKIIAEWDSTGSSPKGFSWENLQYYDRGARDSSNSIDSLTNISSADLLEQSAESDLDKKSQECMAKPELGECEQFIVQGNLEKTKHDVAVQMSLRNEVELTRFRALKRQGKQKLEEYLEEQGYITLLNEFRAGTLVEDKIEGRLDEIFKAKRDAAIAEINSRLKNRQTRAPEEGQNDSDAEVTENKIKANAKDAKEERARLAQVVFFNNIISSHISLTKVVDGKSESLGRNLNTLKVEFEGQETVQIDDELFENLRVPGIDEANKTANFDSVGVGSLFDAILGAPEKDPASKGAQNTAAEEDN